MELILNVVFTVVLLGVLIFNVLDMRKRMRTENKIKEMNTERFFEFLESFKEIQEHKAKGVIYCVDKALGEYDIQLIGAFGVDDLVRYEEFFYNAIDREKYEVRVWLAACGEYKLIDGDWRWSKHDCKADGYVPPKLKFKDGDE